MKLKAAVLSGLVAVSIGGTAMAEENFCQKENVLLRQALKHSSQGMAYTSRTLDLIQKCHSSVLSWITTSMKNGGNFQLSEFGPAFALCKANAREVEKISPNLKRVGREAQRIGAELKMLRLRKNAVSR